jgi:methionyl-tRNA formyltransferase
MGTPVLARTVLQSLVNSAEFEIAGVVTQPDRAKGRQLKLEPSPVKALAMELKLAVLQPERAREESFLVQIKQLDPQLIVVAAYGQILPAQVLAFPPYGCLNVHTSLLPKYRGAAPIQWAILNGESETGVTIMKMDEGMDTGPLLAHSSTPISRDDTSETLHERLAQMGADLLRQTIPRYIAGQIAPYPQAAQGVSYAPRIKKQDGRIDWSRPALEVWNRIRGLVPWPGAFCSEPAGPKQRFLKIWKAEPVSHSDSGAPGEILTATHGNLLVACGCGALRILLLQQEGGRRLSAQEFLAGHALAAGQRLA